ncbi:MAG: hypothetical protein HY525_13635 [Betaproteobacteria bacterium]|nr:hypothetical protein [Betaproteobacteria bacterium]
MSAPRLAAIILMLCAGPLAAADLGRMFFTPAQRATLDNARKQNIRIEIGSDNEQAAAPAPAPVPQNISVNGLVRRSDDKSTVWLNNRAVSEPHTGGINVSPGKNDNRVKLSMPESGRSIDLKVGQTVEIVSGTIQEGYARRATPEPEAKAVSGGENTPTDVPKVTPPAVSQPLK